MKKFNIVISNQAENDLREIFEYITYQLNSFDIAAKQLKQIENAILSLDTFPERYRLFILEPWNERNLRIMPIDNYCVFYIPNNDTLTVTILRVIYGGRNMEIQLSKYTNNQK